MKTASYVRPSGVHYHDVGLAGTNHENFNARKDIYVTDDQSWTLMTLGTIMAAYGHKGVGIYILDEIGFSIRPFENETEHIFLSYHAGGGRNTSVSAQ